MDYIGTIEQDKKILDEKEIIIYGAGKVGKHCCEVLSLKGRADSVKGFCDGNAAIVGGILMDKNIYSVEEAVRLHPNAVYLVASMCVRQMTEKLMACGINKIHIIRESN